MESSYSKWIFTLGGVGGPGVMWALAQRGFEWPVEIVNIAGVVFLLMLLAAAFLWTRDTYRWLKTQASKHGNERTAEMGAALLIASGILLVASISTAALGYRYVWGGQGGESAELPRAAQETELTGVEGEKRAMAGSSEKNTVTISGSNNQVTIGHIGDVINQAPAPELKLSDAVRKETSGGFQTVIDAEILAPYPPGSLRLEAWAPGITDFRAVPQRPGMAMFGHSGLRADHAFTTVQNPFGRYKLYVTTKQATNVEIKYGFDQ